MRLLPLVLGWGVPEHSPIKVETTEQPHDVIVIGGGPGGSTAAGLLARRGRRVLLLEKEHFPRFHIGESLLPYNRPLFEELGVLPELERAGFPRKFGAQFHLGNGSKATSFVFRQGVFTREPEAFQVERARFDEILLRHVTRCGVEVREGWTVQKFRGPDRPPTTGTRDDAAVEVEAVDDRGARATFRGRWLIDASGRGNLTGNQEGLRQPHPRLQKLAVFGHFSGVQVDDGSTGGDTVIVRLKQKWFWLIPLGQDRVSVGLVIDRSEVQASGRSPDELFKLHVEFSPVMQRKMASARPVVPLQTTTDFSYSNARLTGPRLMRVGDAAGFMDPIFSAGVYLAMSSARLAASTIDALLGSPSDEVRRLAEYERRVTDSMRFYWQMVELFYTDPFMEVFLQPRHRLDLPSAVNAVLAGEIAGGWAMRWRLRLFYWVIRLQARWPLVPRLVIS